MAPTLLILLWATGILQVDLLPDKKRKCHLLNLIMFLGGKKHITKMIVLFSPK